MVVHHSQKYCVKWAKSNNTWAKLTRMPRINWTYLEQEHDRTQHDRSQNWVTPFEAAHGGCRQRHLWVRDYCAPDNTIDYWLARHRGTNHYREGYTPHFTVTAKAGHNSTSRNERGTNHTFNEGDKVIFYILPTAKEAEELGRKANHIQHFKALLFGPATHDYCKDFTNNLCYKVSGYRAGVVLSWGTITAGTHYTWSPQWRASTHQPESRQLCGFRWYRRPSSKRIHPVWCGQDNR